jgi:hypothetical protein
MFLAPMCFALYIVLVRLLPPDSPTHVGLRYIADVADAWIAGLLPTLTSIVSLIGGAVTISSERQSTRLEEMLSTRLSVGQIVNAKFVVCFLQILNVALPLYLATVYRRWSPYWPPSHDIDIPELLGVILSFAEVIARSITMLLIGMLISCAVKRTQTALAIAGSVIAAYAAVYVVSERYYYGLSFGSSPSYDEHYYAHLFYWPVSNLDRWGRPYWQLDLMADGILGIALPIICYVLCRWVCARRG